jgi:hypothetical protein
VLRPGPPEAKADDARPEFQGEAEPVFVKARKGLGDSRTGPSPNTAKYGASCDRTRPAASGPDVGGVWAKKFKLNGRFVVWRIAATCSRMADAAMSHSRSNPGHRRCKPPQQAPAS